MDAHRRAGWASSRPDPITDDDPVQALWRMGNDSCTSAIGALDATDP